MDRNGGERGALEHAAHFEYMRIAAGEGAELSFIASPDGAAPVAEISGEKGQPVRRWVYEKR